MPATPTRDPIAGDYFKAAFALKTPLDPRDRKLLALIGAFADAGEVSPPVKELARRLGITVEQIDRRLESLSKRRLIFVEWSPYHRYGEATHLRARWKRNRYICLFAGDPLSSRAKEILDRVKVAA